MFKYTEKQRAAAVKRFWSHVSKDGPGGCWIWQGAKTHGYGSVGWEGRQSLRAHRLAFEFTKGPIPKGKWVLHSCDVPACVRPDHLFLGNARANNADMLAKKRHAHGLQQSQRLKTYYQQNPEKHAEGAAPYKITPEQAEEVRYLYELGLSQRTIARFYDLSQSGISNICTNIRFSTAA